ncbi:SRPBCC family protein [Nocardioides speluncae]|uniref:SRPBCC family protein n=1 Tax=Nocardioides speluncae TaxID=2670337 RepID=UPI000D693101|nr:SRPBCC family protein [Nocardioides speluncae]
MSTPHWTSRIDIDAPIDRVWAVLADVEQWPAWTPTMTLVEPDGPLATGTRVKVTQPGQRAATYVVTALAAGRSFTWEARQIGVVLTADHVVEEREGGSAVTLGFSVGGLLGPLLRPLLGGKIRGYIDTEVGALKRRVEAG